MAKLKVKTTQEQTVEIRASLSLSETFLETEANAIASGRFSCFLRLKTRRRHSALYVAPAGLTLDAYLANGLTRTAFLNIITQTVTAIRAAERARFNLANLELDTRYTLVNALSGQLYFLYQPIRSSRQQNRNGFLREVCSRSTFPTEADMDFLRTFDELVSRPRTVTTQELEAYVRSYSGKREPADPVQTGGGVSVPFVVPPFQSPAPIPPWEMADAPAAPANGAAPVQTPPFPQRGTLPFRQPDGMQPGTQPLRPEERGQVAELLCRRTGVRTQIAQQVFRIGKSCTAADLCVDDNPTVSRRHAEIRVRDGACFLVDQNSTNHTYVNGRELVPQTECLLTEGCVIRFADEEFIYQIRRG